MEDKKQEEVIDLWNSIPKCVSSDGFACWDFITFVKSYQRKLEAVRLECDEFICKLRSSELEFECKLIYLSVMYKYFQSDDREELYFSLLSFLKRDEDSFMYYKYGLPVDIRLYHLIRVIPFSTFVDFVLFTCKDK